jgi:cytochrome P450
MVIFFHSNSLKVHKKRSRFAGQESSSSTLTWAIAYMLENEEAQQKMQAELDRVIGSGRLITMSDKQSLPYTNAVVMVS